MTETTPSPPSAPFRGDDIPVRAGTHADTSGPAEIVFPQDDIPARAGELREEGES
jgi:hypothetical protein